MPNVALVDFGSTYTKLTLVDTDNNIILSSAKSPTTVETDILIGFEAAMNEARKLAGAVRIDETLACSSAGGGLRIAAVGLVPELTSKAAQMAALNAGGKVVKSYSYELCREDIYELDDIDPDIVLLTGGTDGGNKTYPLQNARMLADLKCGARILVACNRTVARQALKILLDSGKTAIFCQNVMPELEKLNILDAREKIRNIFLEDIIKAKGISHVESLIKGILMPTPSAVMTAVECLSLGTDGESGLSEMMVVDIGGATTDVYSASWGVARIGEAVHRGFKEPYVKRTVEGDLGVRYNAENIVSQVGTGSVSMFSGQNEADVYAMLNEIKNDYSFLPRTEQERAIDTALGAKAANLAVTRHCGVHEVVYTANGPITYQSGKDLREVKYILGTGGPIINSRNPVKILSECAWSDDEPMNLRPVSPVYLVDSGYILSAMGLLCTYDKTSALKIMKKTFSERNEIDGATEQKTVDR